MAKPDVPIAKWVGHPASYTAGRKSGQPSVIVIHCTDGSEGYTAAEDGAAYDRRRTDGTSTHFFVDADSVVQEVELHDEAHAARTHGNDIGIQIEVCGLASQTPAQWDDDVSQRTLEKLAQLCVQLRRTGSYPLTRLQGEALRAAWNGGTRRGFCGHVDITLAFPEDNGTHTDPGLNFPWSWLFSRITEIESGDDLPMDQATFSALLTQGLKDAQAVDPIATLLARSKELRTTLLPAVLDAVKAGTVDVGALASLVVAGVLAGLPAGSTEGLSQEELTDTLKTAFEGALKAL